MKNSQSELSSQTKKYIEPKFTTTETESKCDGKKKDFECPTCHMGFTNKSNMKRHFSLVEMEMAKDTVALNPVKVLEQKVMWNIMLKLFMKERNHLNVIKYYNVCFGGKSDLKKHVTLKHNNVSTK